MGYRTMTREDVAMIQERRISSSLISPQQTSPMTPQNSVPVAPVMPNTQPVPSPISPPTAGPGHQRAASAPPAPPPPPMGIGLPSQAPPCPPGPPLPPSGPVMANSAPPPPPPPPLNMSRSQSSDGGEVNSLAAQLQNARLKKNKNTPPPPAENSGSSTSSGGSNYGTLGRGAGGSMANMMDEMAKTLARRRAAVKKITAS